MDNAAIIKLMEDKEFVAKMLSQESAEDVQKLFLENGVDMTMEDVHTLGKMLDKLSESGDELTEDMLDDVAGGSLALGWAIAKAVFAVGSAGLAIYKWYKSR